MSEIGKDAAGNSSTPTRGRTTEQVELDVEREIAVPEFSVRADSLFGIKCMVAIREVASAMNLPREMQHELAVKLREFDLYEEMTRLSA